MNGGTATQAFPVIDTTAIHKSEVIVMMKQLLDRLPKITATGITAKVLQPARVSAKWNRL